ncbi:MAG: DEAD/DEAH box helicase [Bacteroidales bacterium]|nr:DEAD/DEAH box helicase [Bacteroidales bacterium]
MKQKISESIKSILRNELTRSGPGSLSYRQGQSLYLNGQCSLLSESGHQYRFSVDDKYGDFQVDVSYKDQLETDCTCRSEVLCRHKTAALLQLDELFKLGEDELPQDGIKYTRKGMIQRVIDERKKKAQQAVYTIEFADNIFGEHLLTNERGVQYKVTLRDLTRKHGYCNCPDYRINKLGTCKHLIYTFLHLQNDPGRIPAQLPPYPFIEVFLNPFRNNKISYFFPEKLTGPVAELFYRYFGNKNYIEDNDVERFTGFLNNTDKFKQILLRPEVLDKVRLTSEAASIQRLKESKKLNFSIFKTPLLPFQKEGVEFATFNAGAILADDIELGRMTQAVATAMMKRDLFGFGKTLIICPATLKQHWKKEIEKITAEKLMIIEGSMEERRELYCHSDHYFQILNYENVLSDLDMLKSSHPDFIILDEAQRIKNYASAISVSIRSIPRRHTLVLSGSPFDSRLIELYALVMLVDADLLSPLWEFSYKYCFFDDHNKNNIVGYYDLDELNLRLENVLLRREKDQVIKQLPQISNIDVPVDMHPQQIKIHLKLAGELLGLFSKKMQTPFEFQQAIQLIRQLRMLADSTFLLDDLTNISPKIDELKSILNEKMNLRRSRKKVIIFTEWKKMLQIIARALRVSKIRHVEITDDTPARQRELILKTFEQDEDCNVLLSSHVDLNASDIRIADLMINFDAPADREAKSLRMGSLSGIMQRQGKLTIINLVAKNSIEEKIAGGLEIDLPEKSKKKGDNELQQGFPKILQSELIEAIKDMISKLNASNPEQISPSKIPETGQMLIDFSLEEPGFPSHKGLVEMPHHDEKQPLENRLNISQEKMNQLLTSGASMLAQMLKITTGEEIDIVESSPDFNPESGEITLKFRIMSEDSL